MFVVAVLRNALPIFMKFMCVYLIGMTIGRKVYFVSLGNYVTPIQNFLLFFGDFFRTATHTHTTTTTTHTHSFSNLIFHFRLSIAKRARLWWIEHMFWLENSTNSSNKRLFINYWFLGGPKNQLQKLLDRDLYFGGCFTVSLQQTVIINYVAATSVS